MSCARRISSCACTGLALACIELVDIWHSFTCLLAVNVGHKYVPDRRCLLTQVGTSRTNTCPMVLSVICDAPGCHQVSTSFMFLAGLLLDPVRSFAHES